MVERNGNYESKPQPGDLLFPTPRITLLEMTAPTKFKAKLTETILKEDANSRYPKEQLPVYNCWSPDGDVRGELVFMNFGLPEDYEYLEKVGVDVRGKIVIAR
jgi:N-acetylated-alpha-linked acidic dipeptidase